MKVLTAAQMQDLDRAAIQEIGIPGVVLMENAGRGMAMQILDRFAELKPGPVLVLAGKGNNGGDGYVIARHLREQGWQADTLVLAGRPAISGDAEVNLKILEACGGQVAFAPDDASLEECLAAVQQPRLLVDALFGTGLTKPATGHYERAIDWINGQPARVAAVDIPSGINASSGEILGTCVSADLTVTFAFPKIGLVSYPGAGHVGELVTVDIGIPRQLHQKVGDDCLLVDENVARELLPARPADGHKGTFGHLAVVAGSIGKTGAAVMSSEAALRGGCGLVTLACPAELQPVVAGKLTEVMTIPLADEGGEVSVKALPALLAFLEGKQALAIGPGLGLGAGAADLIRRLLRNCPLPVVIDADALSALVGNLDVLEQRRNVATILTPHPGEMARLVDLTIQQVQDDRISAARGFAVRYGVVVVLKGARTVTAFPDGRLRINASGHAGMASGGMGDVLTGLIGSFLAQGLEAGKAAALGVYLHGVSGDRLASVYGNAGLLASDLLAALPAARRVLTME